jgi:glycosyltransferase involved in cell wall biosynthesis
VTSALAIRPATAAPRPVYRDISRAEPAAPPEPLHYVHLSFEGPDPYAHAGGLAVRVATLARSLAAKGHPTDLYFIGDPHEPGVEMRDGVTLRRWSQAISAGAPGGVYDDEERKIEDWCIWLPGHLAAVVRADAERGVRTVVLAEDWHTVWPLVGLHDELVRQGLRHHATLAWTANNRFGFDRIDFARLGRSATLLTISRAMKHLMWRRGVNPKVVPNGLEDDWFDTDPDDGAALRRGFGDRFALAKVGRWDPDKRWHMAIEAVARLRDDRRDGVLLARGWNGSPEASRHYGELRSHAAAIGLPWVVCDRAEDLAATATTTALPPHAVVELAFPIEGPALRGLYRAADAVLANSGFEPFGLVGLEAMATGAVVIAGSTGEDYVSSFRNGFALDTDDPCEIVRCLRWLERDPARSDALRNAARTTAMQYRWADVIERLTIALELDGASR